MLDRVADAATVQSTTLAEETVPPVVIDAIQLERREELAGQWGEPDAGEPIEYEHLVVAYERGAFELTLFNRGILLIFSDDERVRRTHRLPEILSKPASQAVRRPWSEGPDG